MAQAKTKGTYDKIVEYRLSIYRTGKDTPDIVSVECKGKLYLPITNKNYKATKKNIKIYCLELMKVDSLIEKITIDIVRRYGNLCR